MPTSERADLKRMGFDGKCTARRQRDGQPCRRPAARGATVCPVHGGAAPQVKAAAQRRLQQAADALVQRLLRFALDGDTPDNVALAAIRDALDRAGLGAKQAVEVGVELKPYEEMFAGIAKITRAEHRARYGQPPDDPPALAGRADDPAEIVDAELVEPDPAASRPSVAKDEPAGADALDDPAGNPAPRSGPPSRPPCRELATLEDATADTGQANRAAARTARVRRVR